MGKTVFSFKYRELDLEEWKEGELEDSDLNHIHGTAKKASKRGFEQFKYLIRINSAIQAKHGSNINKNMVKELNKKTERQLTEESGLIDDLKGKSNLEFVGAELSRFSGKQSLIISKNKLYIIMQLSSHESLRNKEDKITSKLPASAEIEKIDVTLGNPYYVLSVQNKESNTSKLFQIYQDIEENVSIAGEGI